MWTGIHTGRKNPGTRSDQQQQDGGEKCNHQGKLHENKEDLKVDLRFENRKEIGLEGRYDRDV